MKIVFTSDNHIFWYRDQKVARTAVNLFMEKIREESPDVIVNLGDFGEILMSKDSESALYELFSFKPTLFVLGNHDMYSHERYKPDVAYEKALEKFKYGIPLQVSIDDWFTVYKNSDCIFVGNTGFPDFLHPVLTMPRSYYDNRCTTVDGTYMDLSDGWLAYTRRFISAFEKKLAKAIQSECHNIIVCTHYPILEQQSRLSADSTYFFCHKMGQTVLEQANLHPDKRFYCVSGHAHEYSRGEWLDIPLNARVSPLNVVRAHGLYAMYGEQHFITLEVQ